MLESNFLSTAFDNETFQDFNLPSEFEDANYLCSWESELFPMCDFSNSSDLFNIEEFNPYTHTLSDAFVSQILGDDSHSSTDHVNEDHHFYNKSYSYSNSLTNSSKSTLFNNSFGCAKSWSSMSIEEKGKSLVSISEATCQMGLREKLQIIKIMDPFIEISADLQEFTLDASLLDDHKYRQILEIFKKHTISFPPQNSNVDSCKISRNSKISKKSNSFSRTSRKQREKKQRISPESDELKRVKRKQARQIRKEEKSGLFVYEKVVKFSSLDERQDEDVNILE